ncbi:glycosyltransferase family 4 protein [Nocardiopsis coralliicola]
MADKPRLAVIVANGITGDSRVQKVAIAAARDGWDVTLIGRASGKHREESRIGDVRVLRVPVPRGCGAESAPARRRRWSAVLARAALRGRTDRAALRRGLDRHRAWMREQSVQLGWTYGAGLSGTARRSAIRARTHVVKRLHRIDRRMWEWGAGQLGDFGDWRRDMPVVLDFDAAFGAVLDDVAPDVIHANDVLMIGVGARSAARLRARGRPCASVYDAHEYVSRVAWGTPAKGRALRALEREFIGRSDAVATVSPELAELIRAESGLARQPLAVRNTPVAEAVAGGAADGGVRAACGVGPRTPLIVYSGWLDPCKGVATAVEALPLLPGVRLALVTADASPGLAGLLQRARELEVDDRVHVTGYVPVPQVPDHLSTADLGIICSRPEPNCEISLPTKLTEYLHARLPVVASDVGSLGRFVGEHGVGEVFRPQDPVSFAAAVRRALQARDPLRSAIGEPLLKELSWEHQSTGLLALYRELSGRTPPVPQRPCPWDSSEEGLSSDRAAAPVPGGPAASAAGQEGPQAPPPPWPPLGGTPVRLGLGPVNSAGQLSAVAAAAAQRLAGVSVEVFAETSPGRPAVHPVDVTVDARQLGDPAVQLECIRRALGRYSHLLADSFRPVFGLAWGDSIETDLPVLRDAGISVGLLAHGSDLRDPVRHLDRFPHSHYRDAPPEALDALTRASQRNRRIAERSGLPLYVTTPDLLDEVPGARWLPLAVDVDAWRCALPLMERRRPVVLHAPSRQWTKGTARVLPVLEELHRRGAIEFRLVEGAARETMRREVHDADVVVDQFGIGSYGVLACEAMAAGKPVACFVSGAVRDALPEPPPLVFATSDTLGSALEELVSDRERARRIGAEAERYARTYHDGTASAAALAPFLGVEPPAPAHTAGPREYVLAAE